MRNSIFPEDVVVKEPTVEERAIEKLKAQIENPPSPLIFKITKLEGNPLNKEGVGGIELNDYKLTMVGDVDKNKFVIFENYIPSFGDWDLLWSWLHDGKLMKDDEGMTICEGERVFYTYEDKISKSKFDTLTHNLRSYGYDYRFRNRYLSRLVDFILPVAIEGSRNRPENILPIRTEFDAAEKLLKSHSSSDILDVLKFTQVDDYWKPRVTSLKHLLVKNRVDFILIERLGKAEEEIDEKNQIIF